MNATGIIMECNPFHEGHKYLIEQIKSKYPKDAIVVVLSGDFVQRGAPAIYDKFNRTKTLLDNGADLVFELPTRYALSSAQDFARCGVALLSNTGIVNKIAFGIDADGSIDELRALACFFSEESPEYQKKLKEFLKDGLSFPVARERSITQIAPELNISLLQKPNAILGTEYISALHYFSASLQPVCIKRTSSISAHKIREEMELENKYGIYTDDFSSMFHASMLRDEMPTDCDITPEIWNRLKHNCDVNLTFKQCLDICKTKQYTYTRIARTCFRQMLNITQTEHPTEQSDYAPYLRILGFRKCSAQLIGQIKASSTIPVLQSASNAELLNQLGKKFYKEDCYAHHLYRIVAMQKYPSQIVQNERQKSMVIIN